MSTVAAQHSPEELLIQLDGLESAYSRKYVSDRDLGLATPVVTDASTPTTLLLTVLEFRTAQDATNAFDTAMHGLAARMILGAPELALEEAVIDGLGDRAVRYTGVEESSDGTEHISLLAVQDGNLGILLSAWGPDASMLGTVEDIAAFAVAAEPRQQPVTVGEFEAAGGTFTIMPGRGDEQVLRELVPLWDYDLMLNGGDEPLNEMETHHATPAD